LDDKLAEDNKKANYLTGSFYDVLPPNESLKVNTPGQWKTLRIVSKDKKVEHWINSVKILEYVRGSKGVGPGRALSKFNVTQPAFRTVKKGYILL
jgi:hypothetical protein